MKTEHQDYFRKTLTTVEELSGGSENTGFIEEIIKMLFPQLTPQA
jgi:hypothetical protein